MIHHPLIIIGSGPAGLTAATYAARANLSPLVFEGSQPGGQLMKTSAVENWPGEVSILGPDLMKKLREHATHFGAKMVRETVESVDLTSRPFKLTTKKNKYSADALIIATGANPKLLTCPGAEEYWGKGVTSCAVCDGAFYRDKKVVIIGGGDTAMEDASFMTNFTDDITVVHILDKLTASQAMQKRVIDNPKIKIIYESTVSAIEGNGTVVTSVTLTHQKGGATHKLPADGVFVAIGINPNTALFKDQLELERGYIALKKGTETSVPGVFAAGDVADFSYRQAITSAGTGCQAALDAERFLKSA
jgi:thioredoxin reductase (NADPH)